MKLSSLLCITCLCFVIGFSACKKNDPLDDRLRESGSFASIKSDLPPNGPIICGTFDTLAIEVIDEDQLLVNNTTLTYQEWDEAEGAHRYFTDAGSTIHTFSLLYYPCGARITYRESQTWDNYSSTWEGARIGATTCSTIIDTAAVLHCKNGPENQICLQADNSNSTFEVGLYQHHVFNGTSLMRLYLFSPSIEVDTLTGNAAGFGNMLSLAFDYPMNSPLEAGTYPLSSATDSHFYLDYDLGASSPPAAYYQTKMGEVTIAKDGIDFIVQFELHFCADVVSTGYYKGPLYD